ncbi:unnamed protein product, partial [Adineta steineri]
VRDSSGQTRFQLIPISNSTKTIPGRMSNATYQLIFKYNLPALGFNTYFFEANEEEKFKITKSEICILQNQNFRIEIDEQGNLKRIINLQKNINITFLNQGFYWYQSYSGNNSQFDFQASGAYIFRPVTQDAKPISTKRSLYFHF